jgi:tripartite-type tricarboxylate transporter receptor subunit TctC
MAKRHVLLAIVFASFASIAPAPAEEFPNRPITWVVPFAPGGITDTTSRIVAEEMSRTLGQSVLIDNRGGGGGTVGTATHLVAELFKTVTGIEMQHVPYRGSAPALNDMIAGRVDVMFDYPVSVGPHVEAGKLKVLATTAPERLRAFPDVPTMAELGMKEMTTQSWSSIMVLAGTPAPVVDRLAAAAHAALTSERVRTHFERVGTRPMMLQKAEMIPFIEKEIKRWGGVIERAGLEKQ